jgi:hypothetical protein
MLMADTMAIFFVILGLLLAIPGLWLLCRGLWPRTIEKAAATCRDGLVKPLMIGLPITVVTLIAAKVLGNFGTAGKISATILVCFYLMIANSGVAGLVTCIGERLPSPFDTGQPWRATLRGGVVLELAYLLPILGWFGILPLSITIGCGASVTALFRNFFTSSRVAVHEEPQAAGAGQSGFSVTGSIGAE